MIECFNCQNLFDDDVVYPYVKNCIQTNKPERCIVYCPICGERYIIGGEPDIDLKTGQPTIMMFQDVYDPNYHNHLPMVKGLLIYHWTDIDNGNWAICGVHSNLGSGILFWFRHRFQAIVMLNQLESKSQLHIESKAEALGQYPYNYK